MGEPEIIGPDQVVWLQPGEEIHACEPLMDMVVRYIAKLRARLDEGDYSAVDGYCDIERVIADLDQIISRNQ